CGPSTTSAATSTRSRSCGAWSTSIAPRSASASARASSTSRSPHSSAGPRQVAEAHEPAGPHPPEVRGVIPAATTAVLAFAGSFALTPVVRRLAIACGATDVPDARRVHTRITARAGGVAVILGAVIAVALGGTLPAALGPAGLAGAALLLGVGLVDDVRSLPAELKLCAQVVAALLAVAGGLRFHFFGAEASLAPTLLDAALSVAWIVFITNAFNLS